MYAYLNGIIVEKDSDHLVVEVNQIGYNVHIAEGMMAKFPEVGQNCKVYTFTSVREDAFWLYGFPSGEELKLFKLLITVSGIGPKAAMGLLSALDVSSIQMAILSGDTKILSRAPGIGGKSASRIVLELRDKVKPEDVLGQAVSDDNSSSNTVSAGIRSEAAEALVTLGYSVSDAYRVLRSIEIEADTRVEDVIKEALRKF